MSTSTRDLIDELGSHLATVAGFAYEPDTVPTGQIPVFASRLPASPDRVVGIWAYDRSKTAGPEGLQTRMVQVRVRGDLDDPLTADDLADAVVESLDDWHDTVIAHCGVQSALRLGRDDAGRDELTINLSITLNEQAPTWGGKA
jgi:hypothetical protein